MDRLIASPFFNQSRRYSSLLHYVVNEALSGRSGRLKERTVGIDVFHRSPSYDTNADPVVRTTAAQLRHRLADYYSQPEHKEELRISLPPGAYVPDFRQPAPVHEVFALNVESSRAPERGAAPAEVAPVRTETAGHGRPWLSIRLPGRMLLAGIAVVLVALSAAAYYQERVLRRDASLRKFWGPVWDSGGSVLICIGESTGRLLNQAPSPADTGPTVTQSLAENSVSWPDAMVTAELTGVAKSLGQTVRLRRSAQIAFADLRESPDILVGGYNNQWIMRLGANLRYHYIRDRETDINYIQDRSHPDRKDWAVHFRGPYSSFLQDYGVITRVLDPSTEKMVVIASGLASYGTMAAGEFLTQEKYMKMVADRAPSGWEHKNMQVVFSTEVISGNAGPPRVIATWFW